MELTKELLKGAFSDAKETGAPFVFVVINAEGTDEVIAVPAHSFEAKEIFYNKAYNDELVHVMNSKVYIQRISYGQADELNNLI